MRFLKYSFLIALVIANIFACKKNKAETPITSEVESTDGEISFKFKNQVDGRTLILSNTVKKTWYKNQNNDSFYVSRFNYYFTNIKLIAEDGSVYAEPESYHLIRQEFDSSWTFKIKNIPNKKFVALEYMLGVDSIKNKSGANTGDLSPDYAMHWGWLSGYIFLKFEGYSPQCNTLNNDVVYHIGGYEGKFKGIRTTKLNFSNPIQFGKSTPRTITIVANVNELFKSPALIDFSVLSFAMTPSSNSVMIADNYSDMFTIESID